MTDVPPFEGRHDPRCDRERLLAEYARFFRHVKVCQSDLARAIVAARVHCDRMQLGHLPSDLPPESLAPLLLGLVSDLFKLQSAINGLKTHLASLDAGAEPQ